MKKLSLLLCAAGAIVIPLLQAAPAQAQATRTWVSGVGDDANPCSRTAPCKTFAGAISKTATNGEINCLDPGGFGAVTITKSITIDCHEVFASIAASLVNGIIINGAGANVTIRNVNINGFTSGINGVRILAANTVHLHDMLIQQMTQNGVRDDRTVANGELFLRNVIVQHNTLSGVSQASTVSTKTVIDGSQATNNGFGVGAASGANVMIRHSNLSGNTNSGVSADPGSQISVDSSAITMNGTGVSSNSNVRLSNNDISFNTTGISGASLSFGNNRLVNSAAGTAPTPIGAGTQFLGTQ